MSTLVNATGSQRAHKINSSLKPNTTLFHPNPSKHVLHLFLIHHSSFLLSLADAASLKRKNICSESDTCDSIIYTHKRNRLSLSPLTITEPAYDTRIQSQESTSTLTDPTVIVGVLGCLSAIELFKVRSVSRAWSTHPLSVSNFSLPAGRFGDRVRIQNFRVLAYATNKNPKKMDIQMWDKLSSQRKIVTTQDILIKLLRALQKVGHEEGFTYLIKSHFKGQEEVETLYDDTELGVSALLVNSTPLTAEKLWVKAIEGKKEFVQAALSTLDSEKRSEISRLCQAPNSLGLMIQAPADPVESRKIFALLRQVCAHVGQDFGYSQAKNGMSRMSNLPQLEFILSNLKEEEKPSYHFLWKQRELTSAAFDYLHEYLGTPSMPDDHLSFIVSCGNVSGT